ncbi:glycoside hydrolase family 6 protein [Puerhibacterium puerhi]|uniref:glycoside hydrolase family 6 protein n=1 Tax=Puerhibacterium puerhi TaxID=2692623 RepID=UPI0013597568|nr:glycoside hydrolase family 6 protein [Puerhibacterium puerhi]
MVTRPPRHPPRGRARPAPAAASCAPPPGALRRWAALACGVAASAALTACTGGEEPAPPETSGRAPVERNAPGRADYLLDAQDQYFQNLAAALRQAPDARSQRRIEALLETPVAQWLTGPPTDTPRAVEDNLRAAAAQGSVPLFVAYSIPDRDLGGESSGGSADADDYLAWIRSVSDAIGDTPAVLVLEPDALAAVPDMDAARQAARVQMLHDALAVLQEGNPRTAVYLDVGHSRWLAPRVAAELVERVDPDGTLVTGVALNVSNQRPVAELRDYAADLWDALGRRVHVLVDSSMNGAADTGDLLEWCNPEGERVGTLPDTVFDPDAWVEEAYVKAPGESDGVCGTSAEPAGVFDAGLLLEQVADDPA